MKRIMETTLLPVLPIISEQHELPQHTIGPKFSTKLRLVCHRTVGISDQCIENSVISIDNSEDSDIFHNSDHDPFD